MPNRVSTRVDLLSHPTSHDHHGQVVEEVYEDDLGKRLRFIQDKLTERDIVDQVGQCIGIPNDGQVLELGAF